METFAFAPVVIPANRHSIRSTRLSRGAVTVLDGLREAGFESQLVGGCVRDLLLGLEPKDFDIATDARPEQVRQVFRRARLVGRRFRLAHVRVGREVLEVATYRADPGGEGAHGVDAMLTSEHGRVLSDNVWGTIADDARRRDFTINGLYYDHRQHAVVDYVGGFDDAQRRILRVIGRPDQRYREDPVRMLRALRFAAKLGLAIDMPTESPIRELAPLLAHVPAARMYDEVLKLFHQGAALSTFELLLAYGIFDQLFPDVGRCLGASQDGVAEALLRRALRNTDQRVGEGKPVIAAFLFAALLWAPMREQARRLESEGMAPRDALQEAAQVVLDRQAQRIAVPRRVAAPVKEIWSLQVTLERRPRRPSRLLAHKRFRAAYDFLVLRGEAGDADPAAGEWWTRLQESGDCTQSAPAVVRELSRRGRPSRRRPRRRSAAVVA